MEYPTAIGCLTVLTIVYCGILLFNTYQWFFQLGQPWWKVRWSGNLNTWYDYQVLDFFIIDFFQVIMTFLWFVIIVVFVGQWVGKTFYM